MSEIEQMKVLIRQRLTAAVEDIFGIIENVIKNYEEKHPRSKWERQNRLLDILLKPKIHLQRADPPQFSVWKEEVPPEQQERSPSLDQEHPELLQIKEEEEETWTSQEEEQLQGLEETDTKDSIYTVTCMRSLYDQHQSQFPHQTVENREGEPLPSTSTEHMRTEAYGEDCGYSEPKTSQTVKIQSSGISSKGKESMESSQDAANCKVCGMSFSYYASFMKHVKTHTQDAPCVCGVCGEHVESTESLVDHLKSHNMALSKVPSKAYSCSICHKGFSSSRYKAVHMRIHTGKKLYTCSICNMKFNLKSMLTRHMITHTGSKPYSCSLCNKDFRFKYNVTVHMRTHTGERPYSCIVCGKGFIKSSDLERHIKTHTGERPYSCTVCGKGFCRRDSVQDHMRTHTGERPYSCSVCAKRFTRSSVLKKHMKTHTGETP